MPSPWDDDQFKDTMSEGDRPNLTEIIHAWIKSHPKLKDHYKASIWRLAEKDPKDSDSIKGFILSMCPNGNSAAAEIFTDHIRWYRTEVRAADPTLFTRLERHLIMSHDRTREGNVVLFRGCCQTRLHDCKTGKAFCSC